MVDQAYYEALQALYQLQVLAVRERRAELMLLMANRKLIYIESANELHKYMNPGQVKLPINLQPDKAQYFGVELTAAMSFGPNIGQLMPVLVTSAIDCIARNGAVLPWKGRRSSCRSDNSGHLPPFGQCHSHQRAQGGVQQGQRA